MLDLLLEPFQFAFMTRALLGTAMIALLSAMIGTFVVLKGLAFIGDAIAHSSFSGLALALLLGLNLYVGALFFALLTAFGVTFLQRSAKMRSDTALAIMFTGAFSFGIILLSALPNFAGDLSALLLGYVLGIRLQEIYWIGGTVLLTAGILAVTWDHLIYVSFDPVGAEAAGLPVTKLQLLLLSLIAAAIVVSIQAVGMILVVALLITPAATASIFTKRLLPMMLVAAAFGLTAVFIGLLLSYYLSAPPGATIVLAATVEFGLALLVHKWLQKMWWRRGYVEQQEAVS